MVGGTVIPGHAGPVDTEQHRKPVKADVEVGLVDGPGEKGRVDGDDWAQATHGHASCRGHRVLFGDPDVEAAVRESFAEGEQTGRVGHGRRDGDEFGPGLCRLDQ